MAERRLGGGLSAHSFGIEALARSATSLSLEERTRAAVGAALFRKTWAETSDANAPHGGLGPRFNAASCVACHPSNGRGAIAEDGAAGNGGMLLRVGLSTPGRDSRPLPGYGGQIRTHAVAGQVADALLSVSWQAAKPLAEMAGSGELRRPVVRLDALAFGPLPERATLSLRAAPAMIGVGLLEAVPQADVLSRVGRKDLLALGIAGRPSWVWDPWQRERALGRFGWKATLPSVRMLTAAALAEDIGILSHPVFSGRADAEISGGDLSALVFYIQTLAVPVRDDDTLRQLPGARLFASAHCTACHVPTLRTGDTHPVGHLRRQLIHPYTDLLLHDMGEGLTDTAPGADPTRRLWRTAPLWGIGLAAQGRVPARYLHDGRARTLREALAWHGGEASASRAAFAAMSDEEQAQLLRFLQSL